MVLESAQQPVKRGRGRPRKNPLPETATPAHAAHHSSTKQTPVATKKAVARSAMHDSMTWEEELAAFERRSNKSGVLTLLVLLLGIALVWYGMYLKLHQATWDEEPQNITATTKTDASKNPVDWSTTTDQKDNDAAPTQPSTNSDTLIEDYFSRVNNWQTDKLAELQDSSFKSVATLRNYYNTDRLNTFVKNTVGGIKIEDMKPVTEDPVLQRNPNAKAYDFTMVYTLKSDEKEYRDAWRWYTVQKGSGVVINGFLYSGTGVSQSPFFQFAKFGIK